MCYKKLLWLLVICTSIADGKNAAEADTLIQTQEGQVQKNLPLVTGMIAAANKHSLKNQQIVEKILGDTKGNCKVPQDIAWFNELDLTTPTELATATDTLNKDTVLYILVSLAIPEQRLVELMREAKTYGATVALRGLKNDSYQQTALALQKIIQSAGYGLVIDPNIFKEYNVTKVPQFVLVTPKTKKSDQVMGNISVTYALESMAKHGELKQQARALLKGSQ